MKALLTLLIAGAGLLGCATTPTPDPWASIDVPDRAAKTPLRAPEWPLPSINDEGDAAYSHDQIVALDAYRIVSQGTHDLALAHAHRIDALQDSVAHLTNAGKAQRRVADMRKEILEEERRRNAWEKLTLYGMMLVVLGIAAL